MVRVECTCYAFVANLGKYGTKLLTTFNDEGSHTTGYEIMFDMVSMPQINSKYDVF